MIIKSGSSASFTEEIDGFWGTFGTPGGVVDYLECKAHLGECGPPLQRQMVQHLRPVREVLPVEEMDFDQLLQRDLEDHRIARDLIPYLLGSATNRPGFFGPILCVLLPFTGSAPEALPTPNRREFEDPSSGMSFKSEEFGDCFAIEKLTEDGEISPIHYGRLRWNKDRAKIVVLDGQHRAMAALAIHRTVNESWGDSGGAKYKLFYESAVKELLKGTAPPELSLPVTVFWLPKITNDNKTPHRVARQIFVDVNNNAKRPNEARLILLSEDELHRVLTREFLDRVRKTFRELPLYAVEYDTPGQVSVERQRWSSLTNIGTLEEAVKRAVFGPSYLVENLAKEIKRGADPWIDMSSNMRENLEIYDSYPEIIVEPDREFSVEHVSNRQFPWEDRRLLLDTFWEKYGEGLAVILANTHPYRSHLGALSELEREWPRGTNESELSYESLFVGTGMYWTLRDLDRSAHDAEKPMQISADAKKAWSILGERKALFRETVASHLLNKAEPTTSDINAATSYLDLLSTLAAQVGLIMTWVSLAERGGVERERRTDFARAFCSVLNQVLNSQPRQCAGTLVRVLDRNIEHPINMLRALERNRWVQWRYLWLEVLDSPLAAQLTAFGIDRKLISVLRLEAQAPYKDFLIRARVNTEKQNDPGKSSSVYQDRASRFITSAMAKAQEYWLRSPDSSLTGDQQVAEPESDDPLDDDELDEASDDPTDT